MKILVTLSGGLDSLGVLYKALTDPAYKSYDIVAHHVHLINIENRAFAERQAIAEILHYFKSRPEQYRAFEYSESTLEVPYNGPRGMFDSDAVNFIAGYLCSIDPEIVEVHTGVTASDGEGGDGRDQYLADRQRIGRELVAVFSPAKKVYPLHHMTKREIWNMMPTDLAKLAWSCRRPTYEAGTPIACGICATCKQIKAALDPDSP